MTATLLRARVRPQQAHRQRMEAEGGSGLLSPEMLRFAERVARSREPVLLLGETGAGKTSLARLIHELSARAGKPFRSVNCGAIPDTLFEREMFGHLRGAFTDARESREGLFEAADGGTLFLDEIGELPLTAQAKLLAVLEDGRVRRLGSSRDTVVDVRVVTATNADLAAMVAQKCFRQDLFHRLAVLRYRVPPLRERRADLPAIVRALLARAAEDGDVPPVTEAAMRAIRAYPWPGNVRELDNALRHALLYAEGAPIEPEHLPEEVHAACPLALPRLAVLPGAEPRRYASPASPDEEKERVLEALRAEGGNRTRAARRLGMSRCTLWIKMQKHGIALEEQGPAPSP